MSRRDELLQTAIHLFRKNGFHTTGIEMLLKESGVSKPTLYRHFASKEALIVAALKQWDVEARAWLIGAMRSRGKTPRDHLLALFDVLQDWFEQPDFQGCLFINATVEFADQGNSIHQTALEHKKRFAAEVREIVALAGATTPADLTSALMLLMDGAIVTAHTTGRSDAAVQAKAIASNLIDQSLEP
ncbi:MAG: TetR/AcrR family transcriptional regulator [Geminicoccaceae bacterium]